MELRLHYFYSTLKNLFEPYCPNCHLDLSNPLNLSSFFIYLLNFLKYRVSELFNSLLRFFSILFLGNSRNLRFLFPLVLVKFLRGFDILINLLLSFFIKLLCFSIELYDPHFIQLLGFEHSPELIISLCHKLYFRLFEPRVRCHERPPSILSDEL